MIRLTVPSIEADDLEAVREVLVSGYLVQGEHVAAFEKAVADCVGCTHAVAVSSCTAALHIALMALDIRPGDIVLTAAYSWIATANVVELCGAQPIFVDICRDTFNMDPKCLAKTLEQLYADRETAARVKAILPVHTFGQMADMPAILELANRYRLPVIEDAACAFGASINGRQAGSLGVMGCFSFHPRKAITTGEGGIITTDDPSLANRLRALRNHGQDPEASSPDFIIPGLNYRMTEFQAALGLTQVRKLDRILAARRRCATIYDSLLESTPIQPPKLLQGNVHVYQSYVVLLPESSGADRDLIIQHLRNRGIEATIGTWHMPLTSHFRSRYGYKKGDFPDAERIFVRSISLPMHEHLSDQEQMKVVKYLGDILDELGDRP